MAIITAFVFQSLDGFYKDAEEGISWHHHGPSETAYSEAQLKKGSTLLFGRKTYEMMAAFWSGPIAYEQFPQVAKGMNTARKLLVSNTLGLANWENTTIISDGVTKTLSEIKQQSSADLVVLGSGELVRGLVFAGLLDYLELLIDPVAIGKGSTLFEGTEDAIKFELERMQKMESSNSVLFRYKVLSGLYQ